MQISKEESLNIVIVAAEASSASYAKNLLQIWSDEGVPWKAAGIGSREMEQLGFQILGRSEDLAVVGLQEIISHWGDIKKAFHSVLNYVKENKPDFVLLMDYPEFNLRLAKKIKALGVPVVYYISPQIWAWRSYRVHQIRRVVDLMLVIFPFEEAFYRQHNVPVRFVGHPLLQMLDQKLATDEKTKDVRRRLLKNNKKRILGLMPGSRRSELKHHLATQIETARRVVSRHPEVQPVLFIAPSLNEEMVREKCRELNYEGEYLKEDPFLMIQTADEILCASGTATLMVGLCEVPMVIMYKMNLFSSYLAKMLVNKISFFGMVNLVSQQEIVPERFQEQASEEELARLLCEIIENPSRREKIVADLKNLKVRLGAGEGLKNLSLALKEFKTQKV